MEGVIKYLDYYIGKDNNSFLLVMERPLLYKDLFEIISDQEYLEENAACFYFKQLVSIVINCQQHGVIHRDIKPENVLVNLITNKVTLIDFVSGDFIQENFYTTYDGEGGSIRMINNANDDKPDGAFAMTNSSQIEIADMDQTSGR